MVVVVVAVIVPVIRPHRDRRDQQTPETTTPPPRHITAAIIVRLRACVRARVRVCAGQKRKDRQTPETTAPITQTRRPQRPGGGRMAVCGALGPRPSLDPGPVTGSEARDWIRARDSPRNVTTTGTCLPEERGCYRDVTAVGWD